MYLLAYLLTYRRIAATSSILVCAHLRRRPRRENTHNAGAEYIYIYICAYTRVSSPSVPKKETKANHHIERERRVSRFPRYAPFYFLFFNSLSLSLSVSRASERASKRCEATRRARLIDRSASRREFSSGGKKKMNALCSINPL